MAIEQRTTVEEWRPVYGCPLYEVSDMGRVRSLPRTYVRHEWRHQHKQVVHIRGRALNGWFKKLDGMVYAVMISIRWADGSKREDRVHRLVLETFVGPCPEGMEGCHYDGDPTNNRLDNLRWDTHVANIADCIRHGRKSDPPHHYGEKHHNSTLTDAEVRQIRSFAPGRGMHARLARAYGVSQPTIFRIRAGRTRVEA